MNCLALWLDESAHASLAASCEELRARTGNPPLGARCSHDGGRTMGANPCIKPICPQLSRLVNGHGLATCKDHVTRCNFSCNLQCNSTLERCKITKYESSLHSADVFSTYRKFFTDFTNWHLSRVELHCKLQEKLHSVTWVTRARKNVRK
jgi:hypothetical protein